MLDYMAVFLMTGMAVSLFLMVYREFFRRDLASLVAETGTLLMFASAWFFLVRKQQEAAINMVFFIPLLIYFYYLSDFSNNATPSETLDRAFWWVMAGMGYIFAFSSLSLRYLVYYLLAMGILLLHTIEANILPEMFDPDRELARNPFLLFSLAFGVISLIRHNFDRYTAEIKEEKEELERDFRETFRNLPRPVAQIRAQRDQDGNITRLEIDRVNLAFESVLKVTSREARDQELNLFFNLVFMSDTNWNDIFILHSRQQTEFFSSRLDRWFNLHAVWTSKNLCHALFYDITREKRMISSLQESRARYLALLEAIPDIFFVIDRDGIYQDVVFKDQEKFYPETSEVIGNTIYSVGFSREMAAKIHSCILKTIDTDSIESIEYTLDAKNNSLFYEMRIARLNSNSVISIARDITRRKKAEFELELAKARAEDASALKSRFLANLSHDIRTPMNAIMNFTRMLAEPDLRPGEREEFIEDVQLQGNILMRMIDNTIQLSKIETNTLEVSFGFVNLHRLLRDLNQYFQTQLPDHRDLRLSLETNIRSDEVGFETDGTLLREILIRLLDNAIKFTREGDITFGYLPTSGNYVEFYVKDTGPGIPGNELENIFLRFYVIEADRLANRSGPGLGLPIAQHLAAILGGELTVDSHPGKGSRFWFRLPLKNGRGFMLVVQ